MTAREMLDERLALTPKANAPQELRQQALMDAESAMLELCHRTKLTQSMLSLQASLAFVYLHRMLADGEDSRSEGKVSASYSYSKEIPGDLMQRILSHRKLRQAVIANANKES